MSMDSRHELAQSASRADLRGLEEALRGAVMEAHVSALNELDVACRRSGEKHWPRSLAMACNFTSNLARNRNRNLRPCEGVAYLLAA
ncbi:MAG: hypothetical protein ABSG83_05380 [Roseiarcus sp.]|jgi:hypothetical protein